MRCPVCNVELRPADRQGIEIDYCPKCRGVWVARQELDRILVHPAPFDIDWCRSEMEPEELPGRAATPPTSKQKARRGLGRGAGFWSSLFA
jgi:Zn-finger nucleic acid-binding protein